MRATSSRRSMRSRRPRRPRIGSTRWCPRTMTLQATAPRAPSRHARGLRSLVIVIGYQLPAHREERCQLLRCSRTSAGTGLAALPKQWVWFSETLVPCIGSAGARERRPPGSTCHSWTDACSCPYFTFLQRCQCTDAPLAKRCVHAGARERGSTRASAPCGQPPMPGTAGHGRQACSDAGGVESCLQAEVEWAEVVSHTAT